MKSTFKRIGIIMLLLAVLIAVSSILADGTLAQTATATPTPTATASPSATAQTLPDAGISFPTYFGIALGILAILLPLLLVF